MKKDLVKLKALKNRIIKFKDESYNRIITKRILEEQILNQLYGLITNIKKDNPGLFDDFKLQNYDSERDGAIYRSEVFDIIVNDLQYFIDTFKELKCSEITDITINERGIFFAGQYFDALIKISSIVEKAENEIILIDGYVNEKIINVLKQKNTSVYLKILTNSSLNYS